MNRSGHNFVIDTEVLILVGEVTMIVRACRR